MRLSEEFYRTLDRVIGALGRGGAPRGYDPRDPRTLVQWFGLLWHIVRASVPLLETAREAIRGLPRSEFLTELDAYYASHIDEEEPHAEWMLEDLAKLGADPSRLLRELAPAPIAAMVGSQYYVVRHTHPALLLGYMGLLEGYSPSLSAVEQLRDVSAAPPHAWRTYLVHAAEDPNHRADLCEMLDKVPTDQPELRAAIIVNALRTADFYADALELVGSPPAGESTDVDRIG